ncbi:MAG: hypothetical protein LC645_09815, partial [Geobacteraceae bacterium]|nr:hypothetical protein [Geobacteraceae bacterium]
MRDFIRHLFPRVVLKDNLRISYTFCLGGLAFTMFLMLLVSGALLAFYYIPHAAEAYNSILYIEEKVFGGHFLHSLHRSPAGSLRLCCHPADGPELATLRQSVHLFRLL